MRHIFRPAAALAAALLLAPAAQAGAAKRTTDYADVRVATHTGKTLAEFRQYTDGVRFRASDRADCFGADNPSSNRRYRLGRPSPLAVLLEARRSDRGLLPVLVTDAFVDDGYGFGVCRIGDFETEGFSYWYLSVNRAGATTGPDLMPMEPGDRHLWYLTSGSEAAGVSELDLRAPARARPGEPFRVRVIRFAPDGTPSPAAGAVVTNAVGPTDAEGYTNVVLTGSARLRATGTADDVHSNSVRVCVDDRIRNCPRRHGRRIFGSDGDDRIRSTPGPDAIDCGPGEDLVVRASPGDRLRRCEVVDS